MVSMVRLYNERERWAHVQQMTTLPTHQINGGDEEVDYRLPLPLFQVLPLVSRERLFMKPLGIVGYAKIGSNVVPGNATPASGTRLLYSSSACAVVQSRIGQPKYHNAALLHTRSPV